LIRRSDDVQYLIDEVEERRRSARELMRGAAPAPGFTRDVLTGRERPATKDELQECNRLLARHRDMAEPKVDR
jgi:hypothetical protein